MEQAENALLSYEESKTLSAKAAKVFQPRTPITTKELFAGRWDELVAIVDAVNQTGASCCNIWRTWRWQNVSC